MGRNPPTQIDSLYGMLRRGAMERASVRRQILVETKGYSYDSDDGVY